MCIRDRVLGGNPFLHALNRNCQETCSLAAVSYTHLQGAMPAGCRKELRMIMMLPLSLIHI